MIIDFLRDFVGVPPVLLGLADLPQLIEYICSVILLLVVICSIYTVFSSILRLFVRR